MAKEKSKEGVGGEAAWIACELWDETLDAYPDLDGFEHHPSCYAIFDNCPGKKFRIMAKTQNEEGSLHQRKRHFELCVETKGVDGCIEEHNIRFDSLLPQQLSSTGDVFSYLTSLFDGDDIDEQLVAEVTPERLKDFWDQGGPPLGKPTLELVARVQHGMREAEAIFPLNNQLDHALNYLTIKEVMDASYKLGRAVRECELNQYEGDAESKARERKKNRESGRRRGEQRTAEAEKWRIPFQAWMQQIINAWPRDESLTYEKLYDVMQDRWSDRSRALKKAENRQEMLDLDYFLRCINDWKGDGLIIFPGK
jgi:hypothetical protein